ncbi:MAG: hypothetical protein ACPHJ3_18880, partial [Rubripirellula sp.]
MCFQQKFGQFRLASILAEQSTFSTSTKRFLYCEASRDGSELFAAKTGQPNFVFRRHIGWPPH